MKFRDGWRGALLLIGIFVILIWGSASADLTRQEGVSVYIVRDVASMNVAPRDALRALRANVSAMLSHAREDILTLPYYTALDVWGIVTSESVFTARLFSIFCLLLGWALLLRLMRRVDWQMVLGVFVITLFMVTRARQATIIAPLFLLGTLLLLMLTAAAARLTRVKITPLQRIALAVGLILFTGIAATPTLEQSTWQQAIAAMNTQRDSTSPALTNIDPRHPLAYYDRQARTHIRQGISLDLSWKPFTSDELNVMIGAVNNVPSVWVVMPSDSEMLQVIQTVLMETRTLGYENIINDMVFYRFDAN